MVCHERTKMLIHGSLDLRAVLFFKILFSEDTPFDSSIKVLSENQNQASNETYKRLEYPDIRCSPGHCQKSLWSRSRDCF